MRSRVFPRLAWDFERLLMIRRSILSHARPTLLLALVAAAVPIPAAWSQERAMQDRLDRLERDLSMLQRQVYRSGPPR